MRVATIIDDGVVKRLFCGVALILYLFHILGMPYDKKSLCLVYEPLCLAIVVLFPNTSIDEPSVKQLDRGSDKSVRHRRRPTGNFPSFDRVYCR